MTNEGALKMFIENPSLLVAATVVITVLCMVMGFSLLQKKTEGSAVGGRGSMVKSKSLCDVSEGLRKEELRTSSSYNSLANLSNDDRVLSAAAFREFKVLKVVKVSHNTKLIRFEIPHGKTLGLSVGRHITVRACIGENEGGGHNRVMRAYTPTSRPDQQGYFDLLVKSYEFGKLSPHLHALRPGSSVEVRGPVGRFRYIPNQFLRPQSMGLVAGGTGLTPCLQVVRCVLEGGGEAEDRTCFTLLFQNRTEEDILLREELDALASKFPDRLRVVYFLSNPATAAFGTTASPGHRTSTAAAAGADGYGREVRGYISAEVVQAVLRPDRCPYVCVCGPSGFNASIKQLLVGVGHVDEPAEQSARVTPTIYTW